MPVMLESRIRQMQVFALDHAVFCREKCACSDITVFPTKENPRTGDRARSRVTRKVPSTLTLRALERRAGLPLVILGVPSVKAAMQRGMIRVVEQSPDVAPPAPAPAAAPTAPAKAAPPPAPAKETK